MEAFTCQGDSPHYQQQPAAITVLAGEFEAHYVSPMHSHQRGQLVYANRGILSVNVNGRFWVLSPNRAAWIAPHVPHAIECKSAAHIATLYVEENLCRRLPAPSGLVSVTALFREMVLRLSQMQIRDGVCLPGSQQERLISSLFDELHFLPQQALELPMPLDRRLRLLCERLKREPENDAPLTTLARDAALSERHLMRLFLQETGMHFGIWRQQLRLLSSLYSLAQGASVLRASESVGYRSVAAYSTAFKRTFGISPSKYF